MNGFVVNKTTLLGEAAGLEDLKGTGCLADRQG
jgi:hypothetical protein